MSPLRRQWLAAWLAGSLAAPSCSRAQTTAPAVASGFAPVRPDDPIRFPRDHGAHPAYRTEWWYVTAWLETDSGVLGAQITFFRSRTRHDPRNPSRFAPLQLLLAHAALADPALGRLRHDQRSAREGLGPVRSSTGDTDLSLLGWSLVRTPDDRYRSRIQAREFELDLSFVPTLEPQLQGQAGYSRKGPLAHQASHYYSRPQMAISGSVTIGEHRRLVKGGRAWLDHEWSSEILGADATGWDWVGLNLDDGTSLMAFRIRGPRQQAVWSEARWMPGHTSVATVTFEPLRTWRSSRSAAVYPVAMRLTLGDRRLELQPLLDDQELDARMSTGGFYWEGAVRVLEGGRFVGRGYLELTGYAAPLKL